MHSLSTPGIVLWEVYPRKRPLKEKQPRASTIDNGYVIVSYYDSKLLCSVSKATIKDHVAPLFQ